MSAAGKRVGPNKGKSRGIAWIRAHASYQGDDCLIWPMSRDWNGYGTFGLNGKVHKAHRFMCELANGPTPEGHEVAHLCGRGQLGCVNPRHLAWKTKSENQRDRRTHGTQNRGRRFKLTPENVAEIRALIGTVPQRVLAAQYGVNPATIYGIKTGRLWPTGEYRTGGFTPETGRAANAKRRASHSSAE